LALPVGFGRSGQYSFDSCRRKVKIMLGMRNVGNAIGSPAVTSDGSVCGFVRALLVGLLLPVLSATPYVAQSYAQEWPRQSVRLILPFGPGSAADTAARVMGDDLAVRWGKPVIVENKPGADGLLAISAFVGAKDDHVLLLTSTGSFLAHPYVHKKLDYNLERDLAPVARIADTLLVVAVPETLKAGTLAQFVELARAQPELNLAASPGLTEFAVDAFIKAENLRTVRVPYKELAGAARDLSEGRIHLLLTSYAVVRPFVEAGKVKIIAAGSRQRSPITRDIPSIPESGQPMLATETSTAVFAGPQMSPALRRKIADDMISVISDPKVRDRIASTGQDVVPAGPDELAEVVKSQSLMAETIAASLGMHKAEN
jgi:tripartite-type tricarboxylate transporter receptor subunit TctC